MWLSAFVALIFTRLLVESWLFGFESHALSFLVFEWMHTFSFFLLSFLLFLPLIQFFARVSMQVASTVLLFGFLIILTPPIIDFVISDGKGLWSFYIFDGLSGLLSRYFTFFGDRPDMGITYGVRVEVAVVTIAFGLFVFAKTKDFFRALFAMLSSYTLLFFLGTFPSWVTLIVHLFMGLTLDFRSTDVATIFLSPTPIFSREMVDFRSALNMKMSLIYVSLLPILVGVKLFICDRTLFLALFRNARLPQIAYHVGLLCVGMGLGAFLRKVNGGINAFDVLAVWCLLIAVVCAWLASVVSNDCFDECIDQETNGDRPLPTKTISRSLYIAIGVSFFLASILASALVSVKATLLLVAYQMLAWMYSVPPFRLKRFPILATFVSAIASVLILCAGFVLFSPSGTMQELPFSLLALFVISYTVSLPLKDFKDTRGDRGDGVYTLPVLLGESLAKLFVGSGIFLSYVASVFVLHESMLFLSAVICGGWSFWVVWNMRETPSRITPRTIFWWVFAGVFLYGVIVALTVMR